ncbi:amidohydrolase [Elongatibacter sediminis]|uniref:Amidohydrolase n=1 Tax=Elongatibacter sediminis TaxID=3119006 RepID=A0AAW9RBP3_9GAMM
MTPDHIMGKQYMKSTTALLMLLVSMSALAEPADTVYRNGDIYTVNDAQPWVQALAVSNKRIVFTGSDKAVKRYIGPNTRVVDLKGRMVMPGINDAHLHLLFGGLRELGCKIPSGPFHPVIAEALQSCAADLEEGDWLVAGNFFVEQFPDNAPNRRYLDELFPNRPVYLIEMSGHNGLANSKALALAGIDESSTPPEGGAFNRDSNGKLTGELVESAQSLVTDLVPPPTLEKNVAALRKAVEINNRYGVTSVQEAAGTEELLEALKRIEDDGDLSLNVKTHIVWSSERHKKGDLAELREFIDSRARYASPHIDPNGIKMWLDGTPTAPYFTAADLDPETGEPEWGLILIPPEKLNRYVTEFDAMGLKIKIHASGAGGAHAVLDAYEAARKANPDSAIRHDLGHTNLVAEADMGRMRALNVVADLSPSVWHIFGETLGDPPQRAWQFRTLSDHGLLLTAGSDWNIAKTPNPFPALQGMLDYGEETIDLISALRVWTRNGAISVGREDDFGTLEPGKLATFIVLDRNLFAIDPSEIGGTIVLQTIFEDALVYEADDA